MTTPSTPARVEGTLDPVLAKPIVSTLCMECHEPMSPERAAHFSYCHRCVHEAVETIIKHTRKLERMANAAVRGDRKAGVPCTGVVGGLNQEEK